MKRWMKTSICALTLSAMLPMTAFAAELSISFDKQGTSATAVLTDVGTDRYAAEVTFQVTNTADIQFAGTADTHAMTVDGSAGTVTLYAASRTPLTAADGSLKLGTLSVAAGTEVKQVTGAVVLDRTLGRTEYADVSLSVTRDQDGSDNGSNGSDNGTGGDNSTGGSTGGSSGGASHPEAGSTTDSNKNRTPEVSVDGKGGKVKADSDGTVTITPDDGYRIAKILVNGKEVDIENKLTGLKSTDEVVVTFEKIEETTKPTVSFTDVQPTDWYAEAVTYAVENGLFQGTSATTFEPNANMNRAMLVTVLYRMSGEQAKADTAFGDVAQDAWYAEAVAWAKTNGIVSGVSATQFAPNQNVTREQMAAILYRYAQYKGRETGNADANLAAFADANTVSSYAVPAMNWAVKNGLISGTSATTLSPNGSATRAQVATILMRYQKNA